MNFMRFGHSCDDYLILDKAGSGSFEVDKAALVLSQRPIRLPPFGCAQGRCEIF